MKLVLGGLAILSILSGFYFFFSTMAAWGEAQAAMRRVSYRAPSLLPAVLDLDSYTDRSKEWFATLFQRVFLMFVSLVVGITSVFGSEYLRDGGNGPSSHFFLVVPAILGSMGFIWFVASAAWLFVGLGSAALRWLRSEPTSDAQRRRIIRSVWWTVCSLIIVILPGVAVHFIRQG